MSKNWLVVGICGVTCGGKTSLVKSLKGTFPGCVIIAQDDYFLLPDAPSQVIIPELNHPNYELMCSLDMARMRNDVREALHRHPEEKQTPLLILEGFALYRDSWLADLCDLRFFITLDKQECHRRRKLRVYDPPDPPGYFEIAVWPEYEKILAEASNLDGLIQLDGKLPPKDTTAVVVAKIQNHLDLQHK